MFTFLKNAFGRGLMILIPVVVIYVAIRELLEIMVGMATPIAELFPEDAFDKDIDTQVLALVLIVGTALFLGILSAIKPARVLARWVENRTLNPLPMYRMLKSLIAAFLDMENEESFKPAFLRGEDGSKEPIYVIEKHGPDLAVIMQPWSPTPFAGSVKVVSTDRIELLPVTLDEFSLALTHFGLGMSEVMDKKAQADKSEVA